MAAVISDDDMIARLLAEANFFGWQAIANKYRLSKTTFFRYKKRLKFDPNLKEQYERYKAEIMSKSHESAEKFLNTFYEKMTNLLENDKLNLSDPKVLSALAEVIKGASEYRITQHILSDDEVSVDDVHQMN